LLAWVWLAAVVLMLGTLAWLVPRAKLDTDIMNLLPGGSESGVPTAITDACVQRLNQQLIWCVSAPPGAPSAAPARWWFEKLKALPELAAVSGPVLPEQQSEWGAFLFKHRTQILDSTTCERLEKDPEAWAQWVVAQVYSPFAGVSATELKNDPLLLTRARQSALLSANASLSLEHDWPTSTDASGRSWQIVHGQLRGAAFDINSTRALVAKLDALHTEFAQLHPGAEVLRRGAIFYSAHAAAQSESDISALGTFSLLGVTLVIFLFFRSVRPLGLTLLSTAVGTVGGVTALLLCFDSVHLVALVLSTSIIGVAVDYALHYLTERMMHGADESPIAGMRKLLPTLALAFFTSALAYLALAIAPFPGFRQLAVYAIAGLGSAFVTVALWFPFMSGKIPKRIPYGMGIVKGWLHLWRERPVVRVGIPSLVALLGAIGLFLLHPDDDVAKLQGFPPEFAENEKRVGALTGQGTNVSWYVIHGSNADTVLLRAGQLGDTLTRLQAEKKISGFRLLSDQIPPLHLQQKNQAAVKKAFPAVARRLQEAGILQEGDLALAESAPLLPAEWLASPVSDGWRLLWFALPDGSAAALVPVSGVTDNAAMSKVAASLDGVHWMNRRAELSALFTLHRVQLSWLLGLALLIIGTVFSVRFGLARGLRNTLPVTLALVAALSAVAFSGQSLNLFSMLALVLVIGIGIDYTLFFANGACPPSTTMMAVSIDAVTTLLSFGMLVFSSTPAIAGFGLVLVAGISTAFVLAPLAQSPQIKRRF
jgi:predicted exporter